MIAIKMADVAQIDLEGDRVVRLDVCRCLSLPHQVAERQKGCEVVLNEDCLSTPPPRSGQVS